MGQRLKRSREGGHRETAGHCARTPGTGRHTQTRSCIHTTTLPCTQVHASAHCHTDLCWHLGGQPHLQSSPGCRSGSEPCPLQCNSPPRLKRSCLARLSSGVHLKSQGHHSLQHRPTSVKGPAGSAFSREEQDLQFISGHLT